MPHNRMACGCKGPAADLAVNPSNLKRQARFTLRETIVNFLLLVLCTHCTCWYGLCALGYAISISPSAAELRRSYKPELGNGDVPGRLHSWWNNPTFYVHGACPSTITSNILHCRPALSTRVIMTTHYQSLYYMGTIYMSTCPVELMYKIRPLFHRS